MDRKYQKFVFIFFLVFEKGHDAVFVDFVTMRGKGLKRGQQARGKTTLTIQSPSHSTQSTTSLCPLQQPQTRIICCTISILGKSSVLYLLSTRSSFDPSPAIMAAETGSIMDQLDTTTLVSLSAVLVILFSSYGLSLATLASDTPKRLRVLFIWHFFDFLIHSIFEGSFLYVSSPLPFPFPPSLPLSSPIQRLHNS